MAVLDQSFSLKKRIGIGCVFTLMVAAVISLGLMSMRRSMSDFARAIKNGEGARAQLVEESRTTFEQKIEETEEIYGEEETTIQETN